MFQNLLKDPYLGKCMKNIQNIGREEKNANKSNKDSNSKKANISIIILGQEVEIEVEVVTKSITKRKRIFSKKLVKKEEKLLKNGTKICKKMKRKKVDKFIIFIFIN